MKVIQETRHSH